MQWMTQTKPASPRLPTMLMVASILALSVAAAAPASAAPTVSQLTLHSRQQYTSSGMTLRVGDSVTIRASGTIRFGGGKIQSVAPPGIPAGPQCDAIRQSEPRRNHFPALGESCWSLIGRIGTGKPFEVGSEKSFRAPHAGLLWLGLNDNFVDDNTGSWQATISVTAAPTTATTAGTPTTPTAKKSSNTVVFVLIGVGALALLLILAWARRRTKRRGKAETDPVVAASDEPAFAEAGAPLLAESASGLAAASAVAVASAPPETDSIDVNIFEVEFSNGLTLRVGYNHFPEGTELKWRVSQNRLPAAAGSFIAQGGGSTNHVQTIPLGVKLEGRETHPDGADVQFDWSVNGVPFRYSVRRDTNC